MGWFQDGLRKVGEVAGNLTSGLLDYIGLGDSFRHDILDVDRNKEKVNNLEMQLINIKKKYNDKIDYYNAALEALEMSGLPIPSVALSKIAQKKTEIMEKRDQLTNNRDLVDEVGGLAVKNLDTSNLSTANEQIYERKDKLNNAYKEAINNVISKDIEERL